MSMLAEPRKKVKYSINPRGTTWLNDDDKFGQKLMEKFGWQKGKGLGANETGRVENVKASAKTDTKGFGFKKTNNDNWICHQDDFNSLLSELNASHGTTDQENKEKVISLEEKSKAAKKRVHYHKQAKGKDLSQRSSKDLDCIFGRKKSKMPKEETEVLETEEETKDAPEESEHGVTTIRSNQSVQEYFAMKLAQIKSKKTTGQQLSANEVPQKEEMEQDEPAEVPASEETSLEDLKAMGNSEEKKENVGEKSKKKKKKKSKEKEKGIKEEEEEAEVEAVESGCSFRLELQENVDSNESNEADENCDENLSLKKARKSKRKKRSKEYANNATETGAATETVMEEVPVIEEDNKMESGETILVTKPKKKKRDKKCKDEIGEPDTRAADPEILQDSSFCDRDVSKSITAEGAEVTFGAVKKEMPDEEVGIADGETATKPKKGKKNKRIKDESEAVDMATAEIDIQDKPVAFDVDHNSSSNASRVADNNDEETVASPPKKKKKKKSSKKSKSDADEDEDALTAADDSTIQKTEPQISGLSETQESEQSSVSGYASWGGSNSLSKDSQHLIPENKNDIKRSPYAVHTATKIFQGVGANVDKICGYGYSME